MDVSFYVAAVLAFAPTLALMFVLLRPYTYPATEHPYFNDASFFMLFAIGLVAGTILFMVFTYIMAQVIYDILYAVIQVLAVVVVMNLKRFRGKSDSLFYGYGFGLGAGCTTATGWIYFAGGKEVFAGGIGVAALAAVFIVALAMILQFASVGITAGEGIARHNPMQFAVQAMIYNVVFWAIFWIMLNNLKDNNEALYWMFAVFLLAISSLYLCYGFKKEVEPMVREVSRQNAKKVRKHSERSGPVAAVSRFVDVAIGEHLPQHLLRPLRLHFLDVLEGKLPVDAGEPLR